MSNNILLNKIFQLLWNDFAKQDGKHLLKIFDSQQIHLDHLAIIDLPSINSGRLQLKKIFEALEFVVAGNAYLPEKQNPFLWMREKNHPETSIKSTFPQIVLADFELEAFPAKQQAILKKYADQAYPFNHQQFKEYLSDIKEGNQSAVNNCAQLIAAYITNRPWPLPTKAEVLSIMEFNELAAWVLVFGRRVNHFGISVYLLNQFANLNTFNNYVANTKLIELNHSLSAIKGGEHCGIAQSSTMGQWQEVMLAEGDSIKMRSSFTEFVWRYPANANFMPQIAKDYYMDFVPTNANYVIESLYTLFT